MKDDSDDVLFLVHVPRIYSVVLHFSTPIPPLPLFLPAFQLFMVPPLRKAILEATLPRRKLEDYPRELVGRRVALQWEAGGVMEAFVVSYNEQTGEIRMVSVWRGSLCFVFFVCIGLFLWLADWLVY